MRIGFGLEPIKGLSLDLIVKLLRKIPLEHFEFNWRVIPKVEDVLKIRGTTNKEEKIALIRGAVFIRKPFQSSLVNGWICHEPHQALYSSRVSTVAMFAST